MWDVTKYSEYGGYSYRFLLTHPVWDVTMNRNLNGTESVTFLLTHPVWDVTAERGQAGSIRGFLLTHPVWDVTAIV